jgi:predicted metal-dependent enzyme (double-stranded beta helix superfamily)
MRFSALPTLIESLDLEERRGSSHRRPPRDNVRAVQNLLSAGLSDEDFYLDCIGLEIDANLRRSAEAPKQSLFRMPDLGMRVQMFYWYPGRTIAPHEHSAWTVTAVFYNALQITTYDFDLAFREQRLERKNVFGTVQGQAGHIYERCIHKPTNTTNTTSLSLHIFNGADEQRIEDEVGPIKGLEYPNVDLPADADERAAIVEQWTQRQLQALTRVLSQFRSPRAADLLEKIAESGDARTEMLADRMAWLAKHDRCPAFGESREDASGRSYELDAQPRWVAPASRCSSAVARLCT